MWGVVVTTLVGWKKTEKGVPQDIRYSVPMSIQYEAPCLSLALDGDAQDALVHEFEFLKDEADRVPFESLHRVRSVYPYK